MKKGNLTIFVLPDDSSKARKYMVPLGVFRAAKVFSVFLLLLCGYIILDYGNTKLKAAQLNWFRRENASQKIELQSLSSKINELETRIVKLSTFDKKLRIMANIEEPAPKEGPKGVGGPVEDDEYFVSTEAKRGEFVGRMHSDLKQLDDETTLREESFTELEEFLLRRASLLAATPSIWPSRGWVTSGYGERFDPFTGRGQRHNGLDIANRVGTPVVAPAGGVVTKISVNPYLGRVIEISHGSGMKTRYGHLSEVFVGMGQKVKRGGKIAAIGNTGRSTGPHLHYEVSVNGVNVDPHRYILN